MSLSFSISPSSENSGLISFRMEWLGLLAIQGTLKSLLQHHSYKAAILRCSASFRVQLSYPYMTTGKTIVWTRQILLAKYCLCFLICCLSSVQFSHPVMSDSLQPHGLQHARPPCHHHPPEFAQVHVHCISDAIQPSHPLTPSSALNLSQNQGLVQ